MMGIDGSEKTVTTLGPRDVTVFISFVLRAVSIHAVDDHQANEYDPCLFAKALFLWQPM
jgi:hypothetical protein